MRSDVVRSSVGTATPTVLGRRSMIACLAAGALVLTAAPTAALTITPTFTAAFNTNFGANAGAAQNSWIAAANAFAANFTDNVHINITVDAVAGTSVFGQSLTFLGSISYANLRTVVQADATSADDITATGPGGSIPVTDPVTGTHTWWVTRSQAKALGLLDDLSSDGTTTFGAGNPFTFSGPIAPGTYDFQGIVMHEITEVMGRLGISGGTIGSFPNSYSLLDLFAFTGPGARSLTACPGTGAAFSIDNGATLLKGFNNACINGADTRDWAPGTNDAFNQFSFSGVTNSLSTVDKRVMDVLGFNPAATVTPEPSTTLLLGTGLVALVGVRNRRRRRH